MRSTASTESATGNGTDNGGKVTWVFEEVDPGAKGTVTLVVEVLESALVSKQGPGEVVNGGDTATVDIGNDHFTLEEVENPTEEKPHKQETGVTRGDDALSGNYSGNGMLGPVQVGDHITYTTRQRKRTSRLSIRWTSM